MDKEGDALKKQARIAVVGSLNMDLVISAPRIPLPGETIRGTSFATVFGGKGANQAVAAKRLGAEVEMIGAVGSDSFGEQIIDHLKKENVGIGHLARVPETSTGVAMITVSESGENSIALSPGANDDVTPELVRQAEAAIAKADMLLVQLEIPMDAVQAAIELAHKHRVRVILNPAPAAALSASLLEKVDILIPNETEGQLLAFNSLDEEFHAESIIGRIREQGVGTVLITQGGKGVTYDAGEGLRHAPAYPVKAVDTTAAGDSFCAGLAVALAEGASFQEAVDFAQKVGAITVTKFGAQHSLPYREQVNHITIGKG